MVHLPLQLTKQLLRKGNTVVATTRSLSRAEELQQLASQSEGRLTITELDVASSTSIEVSAARTERWVAGDLWGLLPRLCGCSRGAGVLGCGVGSLDNCNSQVGRPGLHGYPACNNLPRTDSTASPCPQAWAASLKPAISHLDLVINNAGIARRAGLTDVTSADMLDCFVTNTIGPLLVTQQLHKQGLLKAGSMVAQITSKVWCDKNGLALCKGGALLAL